jgi:hypothetical protein
MMKLEHQVCTLEQAKKLKEIGILQESLFYHTMGVPGILIAHQQLNMTVQFSAFTVAELGIMFDNIDIYPQRAFDGKRWKVLLDRLEYYPFEAWARAAYLTWRIGNELLRIQDINARIKKGNFTKNI